MGRSVLIVDDEPAIALALAPILVAQGYSCETARSAAEALRKARQTAFEVVLLDLGLDDADGKEIIAPLRMLNCQSVIVLSARFHESEKVAALDNGADDYLCKPFSVDELLARMRAASRKPGRALATPSPLDVGVLRIDFASRQVTIRGKEVKLSPKEYALLDCLCRHAGQIVTRRQLLIAGWNDPQHDDQSLRVYITMLRQKLELDKAVPQLILTEAGVGYRLVDQYPSAGPALS